MILHDGSSEHRLESENRRASRIKVDRQNQHVLAPVRVPRLYRAKSKVVLQSELDHSLRLAEAEVAGGRYLACIRV